MKALELLKADRDFCLTINNDKAIITQYDEAIEELKELQKNINYSIEEIKYALAKPKYADVYLNNALKFLKERS